MWVFLGGRGGLHYLFSNLSQELWSGSFLSGFLDLVSCSHPWVLCDRPWEALVSSPSVLNVASGKGCLAEPGARGALAVSSASVLAFGGTPSRALLLPPCPQPSQAALGWGPKSQGLRTDESLGACCPFARGSGLMCAGATGDILWCARLYSGGCCPPNLGRPDKAGQPPTSSRVPLPFSTDCATLWKCLNFDVNL